MTKKLNWVKKKTFATIYQWKWPFIVNKDWRIFNTFKIIFGTWKITNAVNKKNISVFSERIINKLNVFINKYDDQDTIEISDDLIYLSLTLYFYYYVSLNSIMIFVIR